MFSSSRLPAFQIEHLVVNSVMHSFTRAHRERTLQKAAWALPLSGSRDFTGSFLPVQPDSEGTRQCQGLGRALAGETGARSEGQAGSCR